jgi:DNA-directed RNA polymerase subunit RPC12/RpoP
MRSRRPLSGCAAASCAGGDVGENRENGKTMTYKTMRFCSRCEKATEHHMNSGSLTCSLCAWKRLN